MILKPSITPPLYCAVPWSSQCACVPFSTPKFKGYQRPAAKAPPAKGIDIEATGTVNGTPIFEFDLTKLDHEEKPWRKPGTPRSRDLGASVGGGAKLHCIPILGSSFGGGRLRSHMVCWGGGQGWSGWGGRGSLTPE